VLADVSAPDEDEVKPTLQVDGALAPVLEGVNVTADKAFAVITGLVPESAVAVTSWDVLTLKPVFVSVCAPGFVNPDNVNVPAVPAASAHVPFKVMVTV
jgi:hypothetical protein